MVKNIAINGFGRIGRTFLRVLLEQQNILKFIDVKAINIGPSSTENLDLLFKYDSIMGQFPGTVKLEKNYLIINGYEIKILNEPNVEKINWASLNIDWIVESSGKFTTGQTAGLHIKSGAKKVLITAPASEEDVTIVPGVNDQEYDKNKHNIISLGSCTTNCFAPIVKVIKENFTLLNGLMTTIHAYTNDQVVLDIEHKDPRRARAAALNMIPTKTGADKVITKIYPDLAGKLKASAIRVPTSVVSIVDFTFTTKEILTKEEINKIFFKYSQDKLKNILEYTELPLVSSDFQGNTHSCIIDSLLTQSLGNLSKVFGWYDNEYGYCCRLKDFLLKN